MFTPATQSTFYGNSQALCVYYGIAGSGSTEVAAYGVLPVTYTVVAGQSGSAPGTISGTTLTTSAASTGPFLAGMTLTGAGLTGTVTMAGAGCTGASGSVCTLSGGTTTPGTATFTSHATGSNHGNMVALLDFGPHTIDVVPTGITAATGSSMTTNALSGLIGSSGSPDMLVGIWAPDQLTFAHAPFQCPTGGSWVKPLDTQYTQSAQNEAFFICMQPYTSASIAAQSARQATSANYTTILFAVKQ
jgi:hypothetical protein